MGKFRWAVFGMLTIFLVSSRAMAVPPNQGEVGFDEGTFSLVSEDKNFEMKIGGRLQLRYWYYEPEHDQGYQAYIARDTSAFKMDTSSFEVYQARFYFGGHVFGPKWRYFVQLDFSNQRIFQDGYIDYHAFDFFSLLAGRFRPPYTRQKITSGTVLLTPKRSIENDFFNVGRDVGLMAYGGFLKNRLTYQIGMFNGDGEGAPGLQTNTGKIHMGVGRVIIAPLGEVTMTEARYKKVEGFHFAIGGSYAYNKPPIDPDRDGDVDNAMDKRWGAEYAIAWSRLFISGELNGKDYRYYMPSYLNFPNVVSLGWYSQGGLLIIPNRLQGVARYSWLDPNTANHHSDATDADIRQEYTVGLNYFIHNIRVDMQAAYSVLTKDFPDYPDPRVRTVYDVENALEQRFMLQLQVII